MANSLKIQHSQNQRLAVTPQLAQSIKLLQMNSIELMEFIENELEKNPAIELVDPSSLPERGDGIVTETSVLETTPIDSAEIASGAEVEEVSKASLENQFDGDAPDKRAALSSSQSTATNTHSLNDDYNIESFLSGHKTLREHLEEQVALMRLDDMQRLLVHEIIDSLDSDGYFRRSLEDVSTVLNVPLSDAEEALEKVQTLDPTGVGARDLGENIKLQLIEKNRFDPAIGVFVDNLELLAKRDFQALEKLSGLNQEDILDVVSEIKALDPRPAKKFDNAPTQEIIPDVFVNEQADGNYVVELNSEAMPKILVNQSYKAIVEKQVGAKPEEIKFITDCLDSANWLTKSLEQRADTILKVTSEIVRQQDEFFAYGLKHLQPLTLRQVAEAVDLHESTISRVTSNKYIMCSRGVFELKFFFTAAIQSADGESAHSAKTVRNRIKEIIESETLELVYSDDQLVEKLRGENIEIARRTVAKYREALHIPSSVTRKREKLAGM